MIISAENFLKNPKKYLDFAENTEVAITTEYGGAVILSLEEYEADKIVNERIRTHSPENSRSHKEVFAKLKSKASTFSNKK